MRSSNSEETEPLEMLEAGKGGGGRGKRKVSMDLGRAWYDIENLIFELNSRGVQQKNRLMAMGGAALICSLIFLYPLLDFGTFTILAAYLISCFFLCFGVWLLAWVYDFDEGTVAMREVALAIKEGSEGFFLIQYGTIVKITFGVAMILFAVYLNKEQAPLPGTSITLSPATTALITSLTFMIGAICSALSGYGGMWVSVRANVRVASASTRCYNEAIQICFRGGAFAAVINVALVINGITSIMLTMRALHPEISIKHLPLFITGYCFGASLVAMFAQLGGGIYTKGADVGADLVGKVEQGIPEDDPRNPAVIADLVGDNVGDCAGQCADTFESIAAEIMSAMILGGALAEAGGFSERESLGFVVFPLAVHCLDLVVSSIGVMLVKATPGLPEDVSTSDDPLKIMKDAYMVTVILALLGFVILCWSFLNVEQAPFAWRYFTGCGLIGVVCAYLFVIMTQYYTDYEHAKVQEIAFASETGPATNIITGMAVGLESTALPVLAICVALVASYNLGSAAGIELKQATHNMAGLFGTAVATMGMLSTAVFVLAMSSFGPIADNAGGIVEMSGQPEEARDVTDRLDAVGNVTKANTKGFSVGSASLACFLLFSAFLDEVTIYSGQKFESVDLANPEVFVGGLLGSALVFLFSSWAMQAVGRAAKQVVTEVRRQFKERPGIMEGVEKPDYYKCVTIVSAGALKQMVKPGLLAVMAPIVVGVLFRYIGELKGQMQLGAQCVASFLMFSTATGILMALFLNNAGGAWDNAKKYIETGAVGGKGSHSHKAAVVGDTVGDPCKDTAGPSVHVLIKLVSTVTIVLTPAFVSNQGNVQQA